MMFFRTQTNRKTIVIIKNSKFRHQKEKIDVIGLMKFNLSSEKLLR